MAKYGNEITFLQPKLLHLDWYELHIESYSSNEFLQFFFNYKTL